MLNKRSGNGEKVKERKETSEGSQTRRENHANSSLNQANCSLNQANCALNQANCSLNQANCSLNQASCSLRVGTSVRVSRGREGKEREEDRLAKREKKIH